MISENNQEILLSIASDWIGTPYRKGGAVRGVGCDCVGLLRGVYAEYYDIETPPAPAIGRDPLAKNARALQSGIADFFNVACSLDPGHVVLFRNHGRVMHCGILQSASHFLGEYMIIHALEGVGVIVSDAREFGAIHSAYAFPKKPGGQ